MGFQPALLGHRILEETFRSGGTYGVLPFRVVILDRTATLTNYGSSYLPPVKHPATTLVTTDKLQETPIGVAVGPVSENATGSNGLAPASTWAALKYVAVGKSVNVRLSGVVPILCDETTYATPIIAGDHVRVSQSTTATILSQTVTMAGCVARGLRTSGYNAFTADQLIVGVSYTGVNAASATISRYALVKLGIVIV